MDGDDPTAPGREDAVQVRFALSLREYRLAFRQSFLRVMKFTKLLVTWALVLVLALFLALAAGRSEATALQGIGWAGFALALFVLTIYPVIAFYWVPTKTYRGDSPAGKEVLARFDHEGVTFDSPSGVGTYRWDGVKRITSSSSFIFVWTGETTASFVPRRALDGGAEGKVAAIARAHLGERAAL